MSAYIHKTTLLPKTPFKIIFKIQLYYLEIVLKFLGKKLIEKPFLRAFNQAVVEHAGGFVREEQGGHLPGVDDGLVGLQQPQEKLLGFKHNTFCSVSSERGSTASVSAGVCFHTHRSVIQGRN